METIEQRWMKHLENGRIVPWSPSKALRNDLIECDRDGNIIAGAVAPPSPTAVQADAPMPDPFQLAEVEKLRTDLQIAEQKVVDLEVDRADARNEIEALTQANAALTEEVARLQALVPEPEPKEKATAGVAPEVPALSHDPFDTAHPSFTLDAAIGALPADTQEAKQRIEQIAMACFGKKIDRRASLAKLVAELRSLDAAQGRAA